jgi:hypothetical protein
MFACGASLKWPDSPPSWQPDFQEWIIPTQLFKIVQQMDRAKSTSLQLVIISTVA